MIWSIDIMKTTVETQTILVSGDTKDKAKEKAVSLVDANRVKMSFDRDDVSIEIIEEASEEAIQDNEVLE